MIRHELHQLGFLFCFLSHFTSLCRMGTIQLEGGVALTGAHSQDARRVGTFPDQGSTRAGPCPAFSEAQNRRGGRSPVAVLMRSVCSAGGLAVTVPLGSPEGRRQTQSICLGKFIQNCP